ncbi:MAG: hypothetical protein ACR2NB_05110 [Solirubrobacteraceae bacterium]
MLGLTAVFGVLYAWGVHQLFADIDGFGGSRFLDAKTLAGATILGLAMFGTLFLGVVLAVFLTLNAVTPPQLAASATSWKSASR